MSLPGGENDLRPRHSDDRHRRLDRAAGLAPSAVRRRHALPLPVAAGTLRRGDRHRRRHHHAPLMTHRARRPAARPAAPTSKYQAAVLAREGLSDWYDRPGPELLDYFSSWHRLANQTRGAALMPNDVTVAQMVRDQ